MSNDLISRRALINTLFVCNGKMCPDNDIDNFPITINVKNVKEAIINAPTAYDVDRVVEQLQTELSVADNEKERCSRENPLQFDTAKGYANGISVALEIVKSGGIE